MQSQIRSDYSPPKFGGTPNTMNRPIIEDQTPFNKKERSLYLVLKNTDGTLYGNKCAEDLTYRMGFRYLVQPYGLPGYRSEAGRSLHNFLTRLLLSFRNGPFWYYRLRKRIRDCQELTNDFVG